MPQVAKYSGTKVPVGYWKHRENHKLYFDWLGQKLQIRNLDDWYLVQGKDLRAVGGASLLGDYYRGSLPEALKAVYPTHHWKAYKFRRTPKHFLKSLDNQRQLLDSIASELNIQQHNDWYQITYRKFGEAGGSTLLGMYNGSLYRVLSTLLPQHDWKVYMFKKTSSKFFHPSEISEHRKLVDHLGSQLGVQTMDDWYKIRRFDVVALKGGSVILRKYNDSLYYLLSVIYPDHPWMAWKFDKVPHNFWDDACNVRKYVEWIMSQYNITKLEDLKYISIDQLYHGRGVILKFGGLLSLLQKFYPDFDWAELRDKGKIAFVSRSQGYLHKLVSKIFPDEEIHMNFKHSKMIFPNTNREMELDIYLPRLKIAFEYQGEHHYITTAMYGSPDQQQMRDQQKHQACESNGITLIPVPFWWDRSLESLKATIRVARPDLIPQPVSASVIPVDLPRSATLKRKAIEKLVAVFPLTKISNMRKLTSLSEWWVAPNPNGIRVFWDGRADMLLEDSTKITLQPELATLLPQTPLDAFAMSTQGDLEALAKVLRGKGEMIKYDGMILKAIDSPYHHAVQFEQRLELLKAFKADVVPWEHFDTVENVLRYLVNLEDKDSNVDGLLFRKQKSHYLETSSCSILKNYCEELAVVTSVSGNMIQCKTLNNLEFAIQYRQPSTLSAGTVIIFQYQGTSKEGAPILPRTLRSCKEITWKFVENQRAITSEVPYALTISKRKSFARCRGCKKLFKDKGELRLEVKGTFTPPQSRLPYPVKYVLCPNVKCLDRAQQGISQQSGSYLPPFMNKICIPREVKEKIKVESLDFSKETQWIDL